MVNVEGTLRLLEFAQHEGESHGRPVVFLYPSSIAAYGLPSLDAKMRAGRVHEDEWNTPTTMYGCNKLYCEHLGRYYARYYKQLAVDTPPGRVDFRCVRFPGLISAVTVPAGGTSDYAPEMIHAAARGEPYACFVRGDTRLPFMTMPDAGGAMLRLVDAPPPVPLLRARRPPSPVHDDAGRGGSHAPSRRRARRRPHDPRVQHRGVQPERGRDPRSRPRSFPRSAHHVRTPAAAAGDRGFL